MLVCHSGDNKSLLLQLFVRSAGLVAAGTRHFVYCKLSLVRFVHFGWDHPAVSYVIKVFH